MSSVNHIFYITRPQAGTAAVTAGAPWQHSHFPVTWCTPRDPGVPALLLPLLLVQRALKSLGLWLSQFVTGPVPIFIHCNSSRVKCLVAALHSGLPASGNDPGFTCGSLEIFSLVCLNLEISKGL